MQRRTFGGNLCNSGKKDSNWSNLENDKKEWKLIKREYVYPVLNDGEVMVVKNEEKVEMLA